MLGFYIFWDGTAVNAKGSEVTGQVRGPRLGLTLLSLALLLTWLYSLLKVCISRRRHWKEESERQMMLKKKSVSDQDNLKKRKVSGGLRDQHSPWQPAPSASGWGCRGQGCCQDCGWGRGSLQNRWCRCSCRAHPVLPAESPPASPSAAGSAWSSPPKNTSCRVILHFTSTTPGSNRCSEGWGDLKGELRHYLIQSS